MTLSLVGGLAYLVSFLPLALVIFLGIFYLMCAPGKKKINKKSDISLKLGIWGLGVAIVGPFVLSLLVLFFKGLGDQGWGGIALISSPLLAATVLYILAAVFAVIVLLRK